MRNHQLQPRTQADIDQQVAKLLKGLGNPEPPLSLADVRAALELDLQYYSSTQTGILAELGHKMRVGAHQVLKRPGLLIDVVKKLNLKALWVPDRKRILIDSDEPVLKHRWSEAHEVGHSLLPWHQPFLHGDSQRTLKPSCHHAIEGEANYAAGRLLFLQDRFVTELQDSPVGMATLKQLKKRFGNTMTSTLWRAVEALDIPAAGIVSDHPHYPGDGFDPSNPLRYFVRSAEFTRRFSGVSEAQLHAVLQRYCAWKKRGPLGESEVLIDDDAGESHIFYFETFNNTYDTLTLAVYRRKHSLAVAV